MKFKKEHESFLDALGQFNQASYAASLLEVMDAPGEHVHSFRDAHTNSHSNSDSHTDSCGHSDTRAALDRNA